jgi:hypothetical protein
MERGGVEQVDSSTGGLERVIITRGVLAVPSPKLYCFDYSFILVYYNNKIYNYGIIYINLILPLSLEESISSLKIYLQKNRFLEVNGP